MATGTTNAISKDSGFNTQIRLYYSSTFNAATSESTVSITPQLYCSSNLGNDIRFYSYGVSNAGVYGGATTSTSKLYSVGGNYGGSDTLRATGCDWDDLDPYSGSIQTFKIKHGKDGRATFYGGVVGTVMPMSDMSLKSTYYYISGNKSGCTATIEVSAPYSITYNANGGSGAPSSDSVFATYSYNLSETTPTRDGYEFKGWATSSSATTEQYKAGASVTITGNLNLYAVWKVNSYTLTLTAGTNVASVSGGGSKAYNSSVTATATLSTATGYHFTFDGWYNGSTKASSSNPYTFTMPANALTLTAKGNKIANTYTVVFNKNGGTGTMENEGFTYGVSKALTTNAFTRTGYDFLGWATSSSATAATYTNGQSVKNLTSTNGGTVNLYAVWQIQTWTVSYNANSHGTAPASQTKTYNKSLTLQQFISNQTGSGTTSNFVVEGNANGGTWSGSDGSATKKPNYTYSQTYWNTDSGGTGTNYGSKGSYTVDFTNQVLYAIWKTTTSYSYTYTLPTGTPSKNQTVTVTFNANGGSTSKASESATRAMKFNGWYTAATGGTKRTTSSQISANETVYAQYGNGTSAYPNVSLPTATQCTRTGYNLLGWATSSSATTAAYAPGASYTPTATATLYAVWQKKTYTLSLTKSDAGILVNANRESSPIGGASTGLLSNGATLYYNDVIKISWSVNSGYTAQTLTINGVDVSAYSPPEKTETIAANLTIVMTVELGALVYIDTEAYQAFLDDGVSYSQYEAYIDNGASWDAY